MEVFSPNQPYDIIIALLECIYWSELVSRVSDLAQGLIPFFLRLPFIQHSKNEQKSLVRLHIVFLNNDTSYRKEYLTHLGDSTFILMSLISGIWLSFRKQRNLSRFCMEIVSYVIGNRLIRNSKCISNRGFSVLIVHAHFVKFCSHHENTKHLIIFSHQDNYF